MADAERISGRIKARIAAEAVYALARESVAGDESRFWQVLRDLVLLHSPLDEKQEAEPMTDAQAFAFERMDMPFGKYSDRPIGDVPGPYLDWIAGHSDDFKSNLKRYLLNPKVAARVASEFEESDDNVDPTDD